MWSTVLFALLLLCECAIIINGATNQAINATISTNKTIKPRKTTRFGASVCTHLTENVLTSVHCPSKCTGACVLFASNTTKPCFPTPLVDACYLDPVYEPPEEQSVCRLTYQCLPDLTHENIYGTTEWIIVLQHTGSFASVNATMIQNLTIPANVQSIQLSGGPIWMKKGQYATITIDQPGLLTQVHNLTKLVITHVDMTNAIHTLEYPSTIKRLFLVNTNLDLTHRPWDHLALDHLDMSWNSQVHTPNVTSRFTQTLTFLNMSHNNLRSFTMDLPQLRVLDLSHNPQLHLIPRKVFEFRHLKALYLRGCKISSVVVTPEKLTFLRSLRLEMDPLPPLERCVAPFYSPVELGPGLSVCVIQNHRNDDQNTSISFL